MERSSASPDVVVFDIAAIAAEVQRRKAERVRQVDGILTFLRDLTEAVEAEKALLVQRHAGVC